LKIKLLYIIALIFLFGNTLEAKFFATNSRESDVLLYSESGGIQLCVTKDALLFKSKENLIEMKFVGANPLNLLAGEKSYKSTIIKGKNKYIFDTYEEITFKDLYPNIDLKLLEKNNSICYELHLNSKANINQIQIEFVNSDSINVINDRVQIYKNGEVFYNDELKVLDYSNQIEIPNSKFVRIGKSSIYFKAEQNQNIIIDPIVYSSYYGGSKNDFPLGSAIDDKLNTYIVGYTNSVDFPVSIDAFRQELKQTPIAETDAFVMKLNSSGSITAATYFGGFTDDKAVSIAIDKDYTIGITGFVKRTETFVTTPRCYDSTHNGGYDVFVARLDSSLTEMLYCTLIGGSGDDYPSTITFDTLSNFIVFGNSQFKEDSLNFPITGSGFQTNHQGKNDCFLAIIDSVGSKLLYSTFLGGADEEFATDMCYEKNSSKVWLIGSTRSINFPISQNAIQKKYNDKATDSTASDCFITYLDLENGFNLFSSYLGGTSKDVPYSIIKERNGNMIIGGFTESSNFPTTNRAFQKSYQSRINSNSRGDGFIAKLNTSTYKLDFNTYLGGERTDRIFDLATDTLSNVYFVGYTFSKDLPTTKRAKFGKYIDSLQSDAMFGKLSADGSKMFYLSYLGGNDYDIINSIQKYTEDYYGLIGGTSSDNFFVSNNGFKKTIADSTESQIFMTNMLYQKEDFATEDIFNTCIDNPIQIQSIYTMSSNSFGEPPYFYSWSPKIGLNDYTIAIPTFIADSSRRYFFEMQDGFGNWYYDTVKVEVINAKKPVVTGNIVVLTNSEEEYSTQFLSQFTYEWFVSGGDVVAGQGTNTVTVRWKNDISGAVYCILKNDFGCADTSNPLNVALTVDSIPFIRIIKGSKQKCSADSLILDAGLGFRDILWSTGERTRIINVFNAGKYFYRALNVIGRLVYSDTITVITSPSPAKPIIRYTDGIFRCLSLNVKYQWYYNDSPINNGTARTQRKIGNGDYYCIVTSGFCGNKSDVITVNDTFFTDIEWRKEEIGEIFVIDNKLIISNDEKNYNYEITDLIGNKLLKGTIQSNYIDVDFLPNGIYFLKLDRKYWKFLLNK